MDHPGLQPALVSQTSAAGGSLACYITMPVAPGHFFMKESPSHELFPIVLPQLTATPNQLYASVDLNAWNPIACDIATLLLALGAVISRFTHFVICVSS